MLLPMTFNIGVIIGPIVGGLLSDPAGTYPTLFGNIAFFGDYPYAAPNIVSALFLLASTLAVWLFLEEVRRCGFKDTFTQHRELEAACLPIPSWLDTRRTLGQA